MIYDLLMHLFASLAICSHISGLSLDHLADWLRLVFWCRKIRRLDYVIGYHILLMQLHRNL
jgi:hypothetical protein